MTFCLGVKVEEGLVAIADTRVTSGSECITARKVTLYQKPNHSLFLMSSGLRSLRDKSLTYFNEVLEEREEDFDKLYKAVNVLAKQIRRVAQEDKEALSDAGLHFNIFTIVGGQLRDDRDHKLFLLYPEGNWVEVGIGTPYAIIGATGYGKPVLDRTLKYGDSMRHALRVGALAFDSTRISAADVDFPIDVVLYQKDSFRMVARRFEKDDLLESTSWWQERLRSSISQIPGGWMDPIFSRLAGGEIEQIPGAESPPKEASRGA